MSEFTELLNEMNIALADSFGEPSFLIFEDGSRVEVAVIETRSSSSQKGKSGRSVRRHTARYTGEFPARLLPENWQSVTLEINGVIHRLTNRVDLDDGNAVFELVKETGDPDADPLSKPLLKL